MKCPFCAEEIRDEAVLCRFCGATRGQGEWRPPAPPPPGALPLPSRPPARPAGVATVRLAGVLLLASAALELWPPSAPVAFGGAVRSGGAALAYHLALAAVQAVAGAGLLSLRPWGLRAFWAATVAYSIDRLAFAASEATLKAWSGLQLAGMGDLAGLGGNGDATDLLDPALAVALGRWMALLALACWWGFAGYVAWRRSLFAPPAAGTGDSASRHWR